MDAATRKRDRRLRRRVLQMLHAAVTAPKRGLHCWVIRDNINDVVPPMHGFEDDDHVIRIVRNLESKGYVEVVDERKRTSQMFSLNYLLTRITALGTSLLEETAGPDPDVDDDRNLEEGQ